MKQIKNISMINGGYCGCWDKKYAQEYCYDLGETVAKAFLCFGMYYGFLGNTKIEKTLEVSFMGSNIKVPNMKFASCYLLSSFIYKQFYSCFIEVDD